MKTIIVSYILLSSLVWAKGGEGGGNGVTPVKSDSFVVEGLIGDEGGSGGILPSGAKITRIKIDKKLITILMKNQQDLKISKAVPRTHENNYEVANILIENDLINNDQFNSLINN